MAIDIRVLLIILLVLLIISVAGQCLLFVKIGYEWWRALIPVYKYWLLLQIVDYQGWWSIFSIIPVVNIAYHLTWGIATNFRLFKSFGCNTMLSVAGCVFPIVGLPILALSKLEFEGLSW